MSAEIGRDHGGSSHEGFLDAQGSILAPDRRRHETIETLEVSGHRIRRERTFESNPRMLGARSQLPYVGGVVIERAEDREPGMGGRRGEGLDQSVYALMGDDRADVAEMLGVLRQRPRRQAFRDRQSVSHELDAFGRESELDGGVRQILRGCDETLDSIRESAHGMPTALDPRGSEGRRAMSGEGGPHEGSTLVDPGGRPPGVRGDCGLVQGGTFSECLFEGERRADLRPGTAAALLGDERLASRSIRVEALTAIRARPPMIVKRHHDRHLPGVRDIDERKGQIHQMLDVEKIGIEAGEDVVIGGFEPRIAPGLFEARPIAVLDDGKDRDAVLLGLDDFASSAPGHALCRDEADAVGFTLGCQESARVDFDASDLFRKVVVCGMKDAHGPLSVEYASEPANASGARGPAMSLGRLTSTPQRLGFFFLASWVGLLFLAHRDVLIFRGRALAADPIESFFFEAGATLPVLHYAAFAFVIWSRRAALIDVAPQRSASFAGAGLALFACMLFVWARWVAQVDILIDALVLSLAAGALWIGGWRRLGLFALPLAILWLARPWPPMLLHSLHAWLQTTAADFAQWVLSPFGLVERSGYLLGFRGRLFEVIEGCSGLRSTLTLVFATLCYAELMSRSRRQTLGLVVVALGLGIVVNGFRVISIMLMPGADVSGDHSLQGLIMIAVGVVLLGGFDWIGDRFFWPTGDRAWRRAEVARGILSPGDRSRWTLLVALASLLLVVSLLPLAHEPPPAAAWRLHEIRREMGPWKQIRKHDLDPNQMGSIDFRDSFYREYGRGEDRVFLFVGADDRRRRDQSSLSPKMRLPGNAWETLESTVIELPPSGRRVELHRQQRAGGRQAALSAYFSIGDHGLTWESLRWLVAYDHRPDRNAPEFVVVRVTVPVEDRNFSAAQSLLEEFMAELEPSLERARPEGEH